jgi:SpoVK/Ycf46/Vps4 family AAA+-type ATPase
MPAHDDGIRALRTAVDAAPDNVALRKVLADLYLDRGLEAEAEAEYAQIVKRAPSDQAARLGLARAYHRQGRHAAALAEVEAVLAAGSPPPEAHALHARLLVETGRGADAFAELTKALDTPRAATPEPADAHPDGDGDDEDDAPRSPERTPSRDAGPVDLERPMVDFSDVGGMEPVKEQIRAKIILPITHPELYAAYGKSAGGGVLMYGPPGCGKTHLARATAGEVKATFLAVGISDILDMYIGESERKLHEIFEHARSHTPCVLFFDEVDALGANRSDLRASGGRTLVNQFLDEMDGVRSNNRGVLVLAATNAPWHLDPAFRRPGRFDRLIFVPPPDAAARAIILEILLRGKPNEGIDLQAVAKATEHFSGADLKGVIDAAVERKLEQAVKSGALEPLRQKDLGTAAKGVTPSTREWFATARNYVLFANQGGLYDAVRDYLKL